MKKHDFCHIDKNMENGRIKINEDKKLEENGLQKVKP